jgi:hypothetical protein
MAAAPSRSCPRRPKRRIPDGKVTLQDLKSLGLLDLYRQGATWVASIRLKNGRLTILPLEPTIVRRKAALQFLKAELEKSYSSALKVANSEPITVQYGKNHTTNV